jgi:cardiolipin synthase
MIWPSNAWIYATAIFALDWIIRVGLSIRVIMRRRPVGVSLAWLSLVLIVPFAGAIAYLFLGELRLGRRRQERSRGLHASYRAWLTGLEGRYPLPPGAGPAADHGLARMIQAGTEIPPLPGNAVHLLDHFEAIFAALIADIDRASRSCHLEFYIWAVGGLADDVVAALLRASARGVDCRVLVDDVGAAAFLKSSQVGRLRSGGVQLRAALPVSLVRGLFRRADLRLHRKIVVIDGEVAYTGSQNLVDPRHFKQDAGVGEWIDAMVRVEGPAVEALWATFLEDWALESPGGTGTTEAARALPTLAPRGATTLQVLPSGPSSPPEAMRMVVLAALYEARRELVLTTPYFVPDEPLLMAMSSAALRGVAVTLIVPARNDSRLVDLASRAFQGDLARAGVRVMLFEGGLLHTKSITVDGRLALFGSLNLDPRSLALNFEITLAVYDPAFAASLRALQQNYIDRARPLDLDAWRDRPATVRFAENAARLAGPLL